MPRSRHKAGGITMPDNVNANTIIWVILVAAFFFAGFALADVILFNGETMPSIIRPFAGWIVCVCVGIYGSILFMRQNKRG
jgi:lysylphosphatidylglycerol synthetase-like protein (DUF2156 family)